MVQNVQYKNLKWVNIVSPKDRDIEELRKNYPFHPLDLEDCISRVQRPKIDSYADYVFLILHFPLYKKSEGKIVPTEVDFFIGDNYLVTLHEGVLKPLNNLFAQCVNSKQENKKYLGKDSPNLLYSIIDLLTDYNFPIARKISEDLNIIDQGVFSRNTKNIVEEISRVRRNIVFFQTIIKPQIPIFTSLEKGDVNFLNNELKDYWGNVLDHLKKLWDYLEDYRELLGGLSDTVESLLSYRTNEIMKVLTLFSVIMLPLTLISGIYGMNIVGLPFARNSLSLLIIVLVMFMIASIMIAFFKIKKWF